MIDNMVKSYIRTRNGQAFFQYVERFDSVENAADPSLEGELVEVKVSEIKWDFTKVKEDADGRHQESAAETDGQTKKEK